MKMRFGLLALIPLLLTACYYDNKEDLYQFANLACEFTDVSYQADVLPVLEANCLVCHNQGLQSGNVNLDGIANVRIQANNGRLYGSLNHDNGYAPMPSASQQIGDCDLQKIKFWIDAGAPEN
ncbi:MAG: hypothetical protein KDC43_02580 [Saprospiraceae bacterium]|nr:hypothetical protein [Saprospiraceae bacterium]MCB0622824.1 hypothetical protein [Saprospiraceae bacterium]MCB0676575.1 hypothetical protein [Saprospiraceae bacterium]MCB0682973.1 hypothetical protein [Saprospiraceae bacterium]